MDANIEALYYACIDRIDDEDIELAEETLIGCITYLHRQEHGRADRDRVAEDFQLDRGLGKYEVELKVISLLKEESLRTIIASSMDFSKIREQVKALEELIAGAVYDEVQADFQTPILEDIETSLGEIKKMIRDRDYVREKDKRTPSLFGDEG